MRTPLTDALGIDAPIIQGAFGPWACTEMSAAVSESGGLGTLGTAVRALPDMKVEWARMRDLTAKPFAINHTMRPLDEDAFAATLEFAPPVVSFALGIDAELVKRVHDVGALFVQQVHSAEQAQRAADAGVDVIIAQGGEAGGFGGTVAMSVLVPQVVDAVAPIPVAAAGGIADGRGLAAALTLGASGANIGTRFLASAEATISADWKNAIVRAQSDDAVKVEFADAAFPPPSPGGFAVRPRVLRTAFVDEWNGRIAEAPEHHQEISGALMDAVRSGRAHELVPFTGQTAGLIHEVLPVAEIMRRLVADAEVALQQAAGMFA
jgi:nitronate monooxygenase/enoyl-[acyl-carrier protein] reductase II